MFPSMKSKILEYLGFLFGYIVDYCVHKLVFLATSIKLRLFADDACLNYQHFLFLLCECCIRYVSCVKQNCLVV